MSTTTDPLILAAEVLDDLDAGTDVGAAVRAAADRAGIGAEHATRLFSHHVGVSPSRYAQHRRAEAARDRLSGLSVLDAAVDLGESSVGRLHDLVVTVEAASPGEARRGGRGMAIAHGVHPSPLGPLFVAATDRGVTQLAFLSSTPLDEALADLSRRWPAATLAEDATATAPHAADLAERLAGRTTGRPLPLLLTGTNLQLAVWRALLRIPEGACVSYGTLAQAVGRPSAVRAVASAVGRNPVAPVVPCHRVLRATGALGGYRWGEDVKRRLLAVEAARTHGAAA